jgi:hypothetical protein
MYAVYYRFRFFWGGLEDLVTCLTLYWSTPLRS